MATPTRNLSLPCFNNCPIREVGLVGFMLPSPVTLRRTSNFYEGIQRGQVSSTALLMAWFNKQNPDNLYNRAKKHQERVAADTADVDAVVREVQSFSDHYDEATTAIEAVYKLVGGGYASNCRNPRIWRVKGSNGYQFTCGSRATQRAYDKLVEQGYDDLPALRASYEGKLLLSRLREVEHRYGEDGIADVLGHWPDNIRRELILPPEPAE